MKKERELRMKIIILTVQTLLMVFGAGLIIASALSPDTESFEMFVRGALVLLLGAMK